MKNRIFATLLMLLITTQVSFAQSVSERTQARLEAQGYEVYETGTTWLGRLVFKARSETHDRELVVSRGSGEVLHDRVTERTDIALGKNATPERAQASGKNGPGPDGPGKGQAGPGGPGGPGGGDGPGGGAGGGGGGPGG